MTSFRQIEANRRNAIKSTSPKTHDGKCSSRRNALRHGLTAETVIEGLEDIEDYRAFEAAVISDYDARTVVERELALRIASPLWRMRRAISIETDLFRIQAEILRDRRNDFGPPHLQSGDGIDRDEGKHMHTGLDHPDLANIRCDRRNHERHESATPRASTSCFLRLGNLDGGAFKRLGRYNAALWRQTAQTLFLLRSIRRRHY
jgi:hypothetical protein